MEKDELKRTELEDAVIAKASEMQIRNGAPNEPFIDFSQLEDFVDICNELVYYYKTHVDTVIGVEVVRVYADFIRYLRTLKVDAAVNDKVHSDAQNMLDEIEGWMDDIITEAAKSWEYLNRSDLSH
jgi:hypothetical protein